MCYRASFLAYAFWVHKNATPKNWLMRVKGLNQFSVIPAAKFNLSGRVNACEQTKMVGQYVIQLQRKLIYGM